MPSEPILVSVVIPAFNAAQFLRATVENIRRQNVARLEIIIADDGSTDNTNEVVASLENVKYCDQENRGPSTARNLGLEKAEGEFITFLDADDAWPDGSLQARLDCLQKHPQLEIALGKVRCLRDVVTSGSTPIETELSDPFVAFNIGAALYRKSVFTKIGGFDEALRFGEDTDWFLRAREANIGLMVLPETTLHYRLHDGGMTSGKTASELNVVRVLKKSLDRRRLNSGAVESLPDLEKDAAL